MNENRPYHHGALREALIEAAQAILAERGVSGLSLRACARRIGVSHAAPKHHFADKTALLTAVAAQGYRTMRAIMQRRRAAAGDSSAALHAVGMGYIEFALHWSSTFRLMFGETTLRTDDPDLKRAADAAFGTLEESMAAVRAGQDLADDDRARERALSAWTAVHGFATLWLAGRLQNNFDIPDDPDGALCAADQFLSAIRPGHVGERP